MFWWKWRSESRFGRVLASAFVLARIAVEADARNYPKHVSSNKLREVFGYNDLDFLFDAPSDIKLLTCMAQS